MLISAKSSPQFVLGWDGESKWGTASSARINQSNLMALERNRLGWKGVRVSLGPHEALKPLTRRNWAFGTEELDMKRKRAPGENSWP